MSSSSQHLNSTGRPVFKQNRLNQEMFSDREDFSSEHQQVLETMNRPSFRFSHPENSVKSLLEGHRDHMFAKAKF